MGTGTWQHFDAGHCELARVAELEETALLEQEGLLDAQLKQEGLEQEGLEEGQPEEEALLYLAEEDSPEQRTLLRRTRRPRALTQLPGGSGPWSPSQRLPHPGLRFNHVLRQSPADRWAPPTTRIGLPCRLHQLRV